MSERSRLAAPESRQALRASSHFEAVLGAETKDALAVALLLSLLKEASWGSRGEESARNERCGFSGDRPPKKLDCDR